MANEDKHPGGRPTLFSSPEEMQDKIDTFFLEYEQKCEQAEEAGKPKPPVPGKPHLMLALGMRSRDTYNRYKNGAHGKEFSDTLKSAELKLEAMWVDLLSTNSSAGVIFYMKNAFQYKDRVDQDITSGGQPINNIIKFVDDSKSSTEGA